MMILAWMDKKSKRALGKNEAYIEYPRLCNTGVYIKLKKCTYALTAQGFRPNLIYF